MFKMKGKCMGSTHYQYGWLLLKGLCLTKRKLVQSLLRNLKLEFGVWLNFKKKRLNRIIQDNIVKNHLHTSSKMMPLEKERTASSSRKALIREQRPFQNRGQEYNQSEKTAALSHTHTHKVVLSHVCLVNFSFQKCTP